MRHWKLFLVATIVVVSAGSSEAQQPGIAWQPDIATAQQIAAQTNRLVLVHFWAPWCKPCQKLEQDVFSRPDTADALNRNFVCVKINTDESKPIATTYNVTTLPTDVVLSSNGRLIAQLQCPQAANQYIQQISQVADGYRQLTGKIAAGAGRAGDYARQLGGQAQNSLAAATATAPPAAPTGQPALQGSSTQGAAVGAYSDDRYADYFRSRQGEAKQAVADTAAQAGAAAAAAGNAVADYASRYAPQPTAPAMPNLPVAAPAQQAAVPPQQSTGATQPPTAAYPPQVPVVAEQRAQPTIQPVAPAIQLPPGSPPLALDGYCTVQLKEHKRWVTGDRRWGAIHRGRTYLFTGPEEQKKFLESPDAFAPVISGNDPVVALDQGQAVPGKREHGVFYENRVYLFADESSLQRFYQNPNRYAAEVIQAMR